MRYFTLLYFTLLYFTLPYFPFNPRSWPRPVPPLPIPLLLADQLERLQAIKSSNHTLHDSDACRQLSPLPVPSHPLYPPALSHRSTITFILVPSRVYALAISVKKLSGLAVAIPAASARSSQYNTTLWLNLLCTSSLSAHTAMHLYWPIPAPIITTDWESKTSRIPMHPCSFYQPCFGLRVIESLSDCPGSRFQSSL